MQFIKRTGALIRKNFFTLFLFGSTFRILVKLLLIPLTTWFFDLSMKWSGITYVANDTVDHYLASPTTWLLFLILALIYTVFSVFECCGIIQLYHCSHYDQKVTFLQLIHLTIGEVKQLFSWKNIPFVVLLLGLIPMSRLLLTTNVLEQIYIPEFIMDYTIESTPGFIFILALYAVVYVISFFSVLALHYFSLDNDFFFPAIKKSFSHVWHHLFKTLLITVVTLLLSLGLNAGLSALGGLWLSHLKTTMDTTSQSFVTIHSLSAVVYVILYYILSCLVTMICYAAVSQMYYSYKEAAGEKIPDEFQLKEHTKKFRYIKDTVIAVILAVIVLIAGGAAYYLSSSGFLEEAAEAADTRTAVEITGHRGTSVQAPENTLEAFKYAIDFGADWIELDVQQMKDGTLLITHDNNLLRVTGLNEHVWNLTWDEVKDLDAGSHLSPEFSYVRLCTLDQVMELCKDSKIKVNLELKPNKGHDTDEYIPSVLKCIRDHGMQDRVVLASLKNEAIEKVKELDPDFPTAYIMSVAKGDYTSIDYADYFSIDEASLSRTDVEKIHAIGKQVWAWTVTNYTDACLMVSYGVDNIITDDLPTISRAVADSWSTDDYLEYILIPQNHYNVDLQKIWHGIRERLGLIRKVSA